MQSRTSIPGEWLAALPDALPVAVVVLRRPTGEVVYANARFRDLVGPIERLDAFLADPAERDRLREWLDRDGAVAGVEIRGRRHDGSQVWVEASARRTRFGDEDVTQVCFFDVTARRRAETELADLARFPEMNPGPVFRLDHRGDVVLANAAARAIFGGAVAGACWLDLCPGMTPALWARVLAGGPKLVHEAEVGDACFTFSHVLPPGGPNVFVYGADITARRRDEMKLAEQTRILGEMARFPEMNPGPTLRTDLDGGVLLANLAARNVFGVGVIGACWTDLCPPAAAAWQAIVRSTAPVPFELRVGERDYVFAHRRDPEGTLVFVYGADVTAQKRAEQALRQSEKMAHLGTLAAGVAHELNNPAAATRRAADQLRDAFAQLEQAHLALAGLVPVPVDAAIVRDLEARARAMAVKATDLDPMERSDREADVEAWLDDRGVADAWELAPALVAQGLGTDELSRVAGSVPASALKAVLGWAARVFPVYALLFEIGQGSGRISEIVRALKSYSYLGQAPVQSVDVHEGIDNTLVILRNKLKLGITVHREYASDLPTIVAWGGELNQVWTNLIDNAADALGGAGTIRICTHRDGADVVIDVEDDGPGIPDEVLPRIFDPFFTTKALGKGTGLGLSTCYGIVTERHSGRISVVSRPGFTCFTVRLPQAPPAARPSET